jgi:DNA gyrase subunit B
MTSLIEKGHLYIAQPPLYKAKIGKKEQYLRDDKMLQQFLFDWTREHTTLSVQEQTYSATKWNQVLQDLAAYDRELSTTSAQYVIPYSYGHQLVRAVLQDASNKTDHLPVLMSKLKVLFPNYDITVKTAETPMLDDQETTEKTTLTHDDTLLFSMPSNTWSVPVSFFVSKDLAHLEKTITPLLIFEHNTWHIQVIDKDLYQHGVGILPLLEGVRTIGKSYMTIQRYKGLGEMNPDQLGETAMDVNSRSLLQVTIEDALAADTWFATLMGDDVGGRRDYIATYGQFVKNLDI